MILKKRGNTYPHSIMYDYITIYEDRGVAEGYNIFFQSRFKVSDNKSLLSVV